MPPKRHEFEREFFFSKLQFFRLLPVQICMWIVLYLFVAITTFRYTDKGIEKYPDGKPVSEDSKPQAVILSIIWPFYWTFKGCYHSTDFLFDSPRPTKLERDR